MAIRKNVLLVEGKDEIRVIPELLESNGIQWGDRRNPVVFLQDCDGFENILKAEGIAAGLKADGVEALGILLDADEEPQNRWTAVKNACRKSGMISKMPEDLPLDGLVLLADNGVRVGIWMMPDNRLAGMLETFLGYLLPTDTAALWALAAEAIDKARQQGAPFTEFHRDKAQIYSWLAWQEPPGRQLHDAIKQRILDPKHPEAQLFVAWFRKLYQLNEPLDR
jgi:hypothetical protein